MYCLSACNRGLFKSYYCYVLFLAFGKSFKYMKNSFNSIAIYSWKKISLLTNIRNKCVIRKINLYFLTSWKIAKLFLQKFVIFNVIIDSTLVERWGTLEHARRYVCKNILNLDCQVGIRFGIFQTAYKWGIIWDEILLPIFCKMFW